jgi:hypothetical protein
VPDRTFPANAAALADVATSIRAEAAYAAGYTGKGVGIALIDTGVVPVQGLTSGNVVNGPDLSLESQVASLRSRDGYGHGTHMAGIIAGRDNTSGTGFRGHRPGREADVDQGGHVERRGRRHSDDGGHRLGRRAPQRRSAEPDPRDQPVLRPGLHQLLEQPGRVAVANA